VARNPLAELIWQGRLQLGDEPGVFQDAQYTGLASELPITAYRIDPNITSEHTFRLVLETENLETYTGYPGHKIEVHIYQPDPANPFHFLEQVLVTDYFLGSDNNRKEVLVDVAADAGPFRLSVRLRCDTSVGPGFYDDFVWIRLSLLSPGPDFYASLGFPN